MKLPSAEMGELERGSQEFCFGNISWRCLLDIQGEQLNAKVWRGDQVRKDDYKE